VSSFATQANRVGSALAENGHRLQQASACRWTFALLNGARHAVHARIDDGWLWLRTDRREPIAVDRLCETLAKNHALSGAAKLVARLDHDLELRAELPLDDDIDLGARVRQAIAGFQSHWESPATPAVPGGEVAPADWKRCCEESGWPCTERTSGRLTVALETTPVLHATIDPAGPGGDVFIDLEDFGAAPATCRAAAAGMLLEVNRLVRMARATFVERNGATHARFEVRFPDFPNPAELDAAFGSLSTACAFVTHELRALLNEDIARTFLAVRGWTAETNNPA